MHSSIVYVHKPALFLAKLLIATLTLISVVTGVFAEKASTSSDSYEVVQIQNGSFEYGIRGWKATPQDSARVSEQRAFEGNRSLYFDSPDEIVSARIKVEKGQAYELRGKCYLTKSWGLLVRVKKFDLRGNLLNPPDADIAYTATNGMNQWDTFTLQFFTCEECEYIRISAFTYDKDVTSARPVGWLDDFQLAKVENALRKPAWQGQYKIKPYEKESLTDADVVAPDGIVYPNWTKVGVQGGIPEVESIAHIEDFGGFADDGKCVAAALENGCAEVAKRGAGALLLGEGVYNLQRKVVIRQNNVVIRGKGADKTRIVFGLNNKGITILPLAMSNIIGERTPIRIVAGKENLQKVELYVGDLLADSLDDPNQWQQLWGIKDYVVMPIVGRDIVGRFDDGESVLRAIAKYEDGRTESVEVPVVLDSSSAPSMRAAVITFTGGEIDDRERFELARDGKRGDKSIQLKDASGFKKGDKIQIVAPPTERWNDLVKNACRWGYYRRYALQVERKEGNTLFFGQPLRIDYPIIDGSYVYRYYPIERCGIEDLSFEQVGQVQQQLKLVGVLFHNAWNCWARNVNIDRPGTHPVYAIMAKWCEIRDCIFKDPWYKGGGGSAYAGADVSWDCLFEDIETHNMRHAPCLQWAASGNVVRNSIFYGSDGQWHAGWANENLYENCIIKSDTRKNNSYGYGLYATMPESTSHGPIGPRNVVYNCDVYSLKSGVWLGGMNENWIFAYNRFVVEGGPGFFGRKSSFDHIIKGNVFVLKDSRWQMAYFSTPDCAGVEIIDNVLYGGNGGFMGGLADAAVLTGNESFDFSGQIPRRPAPKIPSIYQWQNKVWKKSLK